VESKPIKLPNSLVWETLPGTILGGLDSAAMAPGTGNACRLATQLALSNWSEIPRIRALARKVEPVRVELGSDSYNLKATLTSMGAGVQSVTLPKFHQANYLGEPAYDEKTKKPLPLSLVPSDPGNPSHLLLHYSEPEREENHPQEDLGKCDWTVVSTKNGNNDDYHEVVFSTDVQVKRQNFTLTKTYTLWPKDYHIGLAISIERKGGGPEPSFFRYQLTGAHGLPIEGEFYTRIYTNAVTGKTDGNKGMWRDLQNSKTIAFQEGGVKIERQNLFIRYAGIISQFFASLIVVDDEQEDGGKKILAWTRPTVERQVNPQKIFLDEITVRVISDKVELKPNSKVVHKYLLYNGPAKVALLGDFKGDLEVPRDVVDRYTDTLQLKSLTDYSSLPRWLFWWSDLLIACTNLMHWLLSLIHSYIMPWSYGLCIIILTVVVRAIMFPLSRKQALSTKNFQEKMARANEELAPEIKKLEEKYKADPWTLRQKKHELYMKQGINPMAMMGSCWMVFAQMPIFLGLYYALQESIHFRLASFLWIPNLAAPDMLFKWGENIPIISQFLGPYFNILPIISVTLMLVQQKLMTPPPRDDQEAMQQKMMKYMMIFFGYMFYTVAAGLCVYFIATNLWGLTERKLLPKRPKSGSVAPVVNGRKSSTLPPPPRTKAKAPKVAKGQKNGTIQKVSDWWQEVLKQAKKK